MNEDQKYLSSTVTNALRILHCFSLHQPELKVTELSKMLGLGKSTVSRLLLTLAYQGFVTKDPETQKYRLGLSILYLNSVLTANLEIGRESLDIMRQLVADIGETVHIGVLDGTDVIYLNRVDCKHPVQILPLIGRRIPAYCTSTGRAILAYQSERTIDRVLDQPLEKFTARTITDPVRIRELLQEVKLQGYSVSYEELRDGVSSISVPIRDYTQNVVYAINVVGPTDRFNRLHLPTTVNKVMHAAEKISERMGYRKRAAFRGH